MSNNLDSDLGSNCLQRLSADDKSCNYWGKGKNKQKNMNIFWLHRSCFRHLIILKDLNIYITRLSLPVAINICKKFGPKMLVPNGSKLIVTLMGFLKDFLKLTKMCPNNTDAPNSAQFSCNVLLDLIWDQTVHKGFQ